MNTRERYACGAGFDGPPGGLPADILTPEELAFLAGTTEETIRELVALDLICPRAREAAEDGFGVENIPAVRRILRLQRQLQVGLDSMALVLDLLDRIDELERRIRSVNSGESGERVREI